MRSSHQIPDEEGLDGDVSDSSGSCGIRARISHSTIEIQVELVYLVHGNKELHMPPTVLDIPLV